MNLRLLSPVAKSSALLAVLAAVLVAAFAADQPVAPAGQIQNTIITSDRLEMRNNGVEGHYVFIGNVVLTGTNLEVTCDRVEVFALNKADVSAEGAFSAAGNIRRVLALGNVVIKQEGRTATCGRAEVLPAEERILLTDDPVITDIGTAVTMGGTRMIVYRGERYAEIENPRVVGPALPNLGFPTDADRTPTPNPAAP